MPRIERPNMELIVSSTLQNIGDQFSSPEPKGMLDFANNLGSYWLASLPIATRDSELYRSHSFNKGFFSEDGTRSFFVCSSLLLNAHGGVNKAGYISITAFNEDWKNRFQFTIRGIPENKSKNFYIFSDEDRSAVPLEFNTLSNHIRIASSILENE